MKPLEKIYGPKFFAKRNSLNWRCPIICDAVNKVFEPTSVIDVGCAIGDYVKYWKEVLGVRALGIEGSNEARPYFVTDQVSIYDLRSAPKRINSYPRFDLVTCFEVAEHIEPRYSPEFLNNLINWSDRILISAAPPGAGGHHHVNCRPKKYWIVKMYIRDYLFDRDTTNEIKERLKPWRHRKELYHDNLMYFKRRDHE